MTIYNRHDEARSYNGMSLRDYFAAQAISGVIACIHPMKIEPAANEKLAAMAYAIADAMIKARATGEA